jgi:hypothetical protein
LHSLLNPSLQSEKEKVDREIFRLYNERSTSKKKKMTIKEEAWLSGF